MNLKRLAVRAFKMLIVLSIPIIVIMVVLFRKPTVRPVTVGEHPPSFTLQTLGGKVFKLTAAPHKVILINFFTTWCPPCQAEAPDFSRFINRYHNEVQLVMIDRREGTVPVSQFIRRYHLQQAVVLMDYHDALAQPFGVTGQPETFAIDQKGVLRAHIVGPMSYGELVQEMHLLQH